MYSKVYVGSAEQLADKAIDLYLYLKDWKIRHPLYDYTIDVLDNAVRLTIVKMVNINGKRNLSV